MRLGLVDLKCFTAPEQDFVRLFVRESQVDEMVDKVAKLIKDKIRILLQLERKLFFLRLDKALQALEALFEYVRLTC